MREEHDHDEGPGLLVSPAFWIGGALSTCIWLGLGWLLFA